MTDGKMEKESVGTSITFRMSPNCTQTIALTFCASSAEGTQVRSLPYDQVA